MMGPCCRCCWCCCCRRASRETDNHRCSSKFWLSHRSEFRSQITPTGRCLSVREIASPKLVHMTANRPCFLLSHSYVSMHCMIRGRGRLRIPRSYPTARDPLQLAPRKGLTFNTLPLESTLPHRPRQICENLIANIRSFNTC